MKKNDLNRHGQIVSIITMPNGKTRRRVQAPDFGPSKTVQAEKQKCDINQIMKRYHRTGMIDHVSKVQGQWGIDTTLITDYQSALNAVISANEKFNALPSDLRKKFDNDPSKFIAFIEDNKNYDEAVKLGLIDSSKISKSTPSTPPSSTGTPPAPTNDLNDKAPSK